MPEYKATEYLRLSYSMDRENESDSITNQKKLIEDFLKGHPEIELVSEHVDDGYSVFKEIFKSSPLFSWAVSIPSVIAINRTP